MKKSDIDIFFKELGKELKKPAKIWLTGGAASLLLGGVRPTMDVDFAFSGGGSLDQFEININKAHQKSGLNAEYAEDIDRWSMISFLDYKKHSTLYKKIGKIQVFILDPEYWSIGKITRYLDSDVSDMVAVFKKQKTTPDQLIKVWAQALKKSPKSEALFHFKKHVEHFLKAHGTKIWGNKFVEQIFCEKFRTLTEKK